MNELTSVEKPVNDDLTGASVEAIDVVDDGISRCSQAQINNIMDTLADDCDWYNFSHSECVRWIEEELRADCGGQYSCIETTMYSAWAASAIYHGITNK